MVEVRADLKFVEMCWRDWRAAWRTCCGLGFDEVVFSGSESESTSSVPVEKAENDSFVSAGANIERISSILVFLTWTDEGPINCGRGETNVGFCFVGCIF